ncbi:hypothetical protein V8E54_007922 [Elaphomyces granulatus]
MNIALSRAQKVLVIIGNLQIWDRASIRRLAERNRNSFLVKLLKDVTEKGHTLTWADTRTVNELEKPMIGFQGYISHDDRPSREKPHPRQAADDDDFDDNFENTRKRGNKM